MQGLWQEIRKPFFTVLFILLGIFLLSKIFGPIPFSINSTQTNKDFFFSVEGTGEATAVPNTAQIHMGVTSTDTTVEKAQEKTNRISQKIVDELKKLGIEEKKIKTTNYSVNPNYDYRSGDYTSVKNYSVTQNISVEVKPIEKANQAVDVATSNGATMVGSIQFVLDEETLEQLKREAREEAIKKAKQKASELTKAAGIRLGRITNITESTPSPYSYDRGLASPLATDMKAEPEVPTELTPGENRVVITIYLSYETL